MTLKSLLKGVSVREMLVILVIFISGILYVLFIWFETKNQNIEHVLQIASSVEASLPREELLLLEPRPEDLKNHSFQHLKTSLQKVIQVNPEAQFAYLYIERNGKLYFVVDSEPETSPDYSPPGQEFTEADSIDHQPFIDGKALVTKPVEDRWGTWVSVEVPVIDTETGKVIAVFGMDYNASAWKNRILFEVSESSLMVIVIMILASIFRRSSRRNSLLKLEISQRQNAESELSKKELTLSNLISNLPGMVYRCALDKDYTMEFVSDASLRITGFTADDFIANKIISFNELIFPEYRQGIWEKWQVVMSNHSVFEAEYPIRTVSGEIKWVWERGGCIFDQTGGLHCLEGYIEDITDKKINETELIHAKDKAQESDRLKSAFLANLSHEIRTPMNGILGFTELLKEPDLSPENLKDFIGIIETNLYRMLNIITDLIDISRIEAGETTLKMCKTNVNKMLHELHLFFLPQGLQKGIQVDYHCDFEGEDSNIQTDSNKLNQILTNLIKNAMKFTQKGFISFGYKQTDIGLEFFVSDTGPGIQPEMKELIFERFMQGEQGYTRKYEWVGLGLTISKAYVHQLGGSIRFESESGKGTTFYFELPSLAQPLNSELT